MGPGCCGDPGRSNKHAEELQRARRDREAECPRQAAPGGGGRDEGRLTVTLLLGSIVPLCNRFDLAALTRSPLRRFKLPSTDPCLENSVLQSAGAYDCAWAKQ